MTTGLPVNVVGGVVQEEPQVKMVEQNPQDPLQMGQNAVDTASVGIAKRIGALAGAIINIIVKG